MRDDNDSYLFNIKCKKEFDVILLHTIYKCIHIIERKKQKKFLIKR